MTNTSRLLIAGVGIAALLATGPARAEDADTAIRAQLARYEAALNTSDTRAVMRLYAANAVFMPQNSPPSVGTEAVKAAYDRVFAAIRLNIRFQVDEVRPLARDWAYARTRSTGTQTAVGADAPRPEANQELFLLHRESDGQWRFARYIFTTTNPPGDR